MGRLLPTCALLCSVHKGGGRVLDLVWKVCGLDFRLRVCDLGLPNRAQAGRMAGYRAWASAGGIPPRRE